MPLDSSGVPAIVLIVEDAHWLDRPSADALAFVGRRVEADPIILLAAIRDGYEDSPLGSGLPSCGSTGSLIAVLQSCWARTFQILRPQSANEC